MDGPPNPKRLRPNETRDEDLYFDDGSIFISANEIDGNLVYFRVHKSVLAKQCDVFKDMFSIPSPPQMDQYDGLPVVHVHDDAKDVLPFRRLQANAPALMTAPLELANKYQADVLRNRIICHLVTVWPTTLQGWDDVAYTKVTDPNAIGETDADSNPCTDSFPNPVTFIPLARGSGSPRVFAGVFYKLCGNWAICKETLSRMSRQDLETVLLGKECMINFICGPGIINLEIDNWVVEKDYQTCMDKACHRFVLQAWSNILKDDIAYGDPLATFRTKAQKLKQYVDNNPEETSDGPLGAAFGEMCAWCKWRLAGGLSGLREVLFEKLPSFFTLEDSDAGA